MKRLRDHQRGYAVIVVLILLVIGTVGLLMLNRQSSFFSKVSGFFNRNKKLQDQVEAGFQLAQNDLYRVAETSLDANPATDTFTKAANSTQKAVDVGLYDKTAAGLSRTLTPRIHKTEGSDIELNVYYFPEDPCNGTCSGSSGEPLYRTEAVHVFFIVSTAVNKKTNENFTLEGRIAVHRKNYAEIAMGVTGQICLDATEPKKPQDCAKPFPDSYPLKFSPAVYGTTHMNLLPNLIQFEMIGVKPPDDPTQMHTFTGPATFQYPTPSGEDYPFTVETVSKDGNTKSTMVKFEQGFQDDKQTFTGKYDLAGNVDPDYIETEDPSNEKFYTDTLKPKAAQDFSTRPCTTPPAIGVNNTVTKGQVDVCLKLDGNVVREYQCNTRNDYVMGRVDVNAHPSTAEDPTNTANFKTGKYTDAGTTANILATPDASGRYQYDRYVGEHADVYGSTTAHSTASYSADGIFYCYNPNCDCNIHVKGILDGQMTVAANNIVIEGDIQYKNQDPEKSKNSFGIMAHRDVIIPAGIPQAATSDTRSETKKQYETPNVADDPPYRVGSDPAYVESLAQSYLGITNFIPQNGATLVSRNKDNPDFEEIAGRWDPTNKDYYPSPNVLDLDGFIYAGNSMKVDGIFNASTSSPSSMYIQTCDDPPACTQITYRDPNGTGANKLYNDPVNDQTILSVNGVQVQPLFNVDGMLATNNMQIDYEANPTFNSAWDVGEETPRILNSIISIFGGITSKYYYINDQLVNGAGVGQFRVGFKRKIIQGDSRSSYLVPPGYPYTMDLDIEILYQKKYQGKSTLIP